MLSLIVLGRHSTGPIRAVDLENKFGLSHFYRCEAYDLFISYIPMRQCLFWEDASKLIQVSTALTKAVMRPRDNTLRRWRLT